MTSPIILSPPAQGPGAGAIFSDLLQALLAQQRLRQQQEELKLRKQEFKQRQDEFAAQQAELGSQGGIETGQGALLQQLMPLMFGGGGQPQAGAQGAPVEGVPGAVPPAPAGLAPQDPSTANAMATAIAAAPPRAAARALTPEVQRTLVSIADRQRSAAAVQRALSTIRDPRHRQVLEAFAGIEQSGINVPDAMQRAMWPDVFAGPIDPNTMDSMVRTAIASGLPWGDIRTAYELPPSDTPGIPDDFVFPLTLAGRSGAKTDRELTAGLHATSMLHNADIINQLVDTTGGLSVLPQIQRQLQATQGTAGGVVGFLAGLGSMAANGLISPEQQQLIQSQFAWTNSYRYLVSGQQTSDREFVVILNTVAESTFDSPEVKAQKRAFRQLMTEAAQRLAAGGADHVTTAESVLQAAETSGMNPALLEVLRQQVRDARAFRPNARTAPTLIPDDSTMSDADRDALVMQMIFGARAR